MIDRRHLLMGLAALPAAAWADTPLSLLGQPQTHAIMRHALAPGTGDPGNFELRECATQRNLSDRGRAQSRRAGEMIRAAGRGPDQVWSSQWCRCLDTARLMGLGPVEEEPALNSFFRNRAAEDTQTRALRARLDGLAPETTVLMVTHQVNLTALTGAFPTSGEIFVIRLGGGLEILGSVETPLA
ncbi:MAG: histidine phosphatase family protein [Pseudomonadota bacterium]